MTEATRAATPPAIAPRLSRLSVADFGPVRRADLDLSSNVTFLMGPQSAGKTYLATLAYALTRSVPNLLMNGFIGAIAATFRDRGVTGTISPEALQVAGSAGEPELKARLGREPSVGIFPNLLPQYFGVPGAAELVRQGESLSRVTATFSMENQSLVSTTISIPRTGDVTVAVEPGPDAFGLFLRAAKPQITVMPAGGWAAQYGGLAVLGARYVPAERIIPTQVLGSYLDLVLRLGQPSMLGQISGLRMPLFRQTLLDYVQDVGRIVTSEPNKSRTFHLLDFGDLELTGATMRFKDRRRGALIDMSQAASGVGQVAGIALAAETEPRPDTLFVEEPEINLHADAQLRVADYLGELSNRMRVVITTHSHYVPTMLAIALAKGKISSLQGYYLNPDNDAAEEVAIDRAVGSIALPRSIEAALERIGEEAAGLDGPD